jgi:hypothetical protein
MNELRQNLLRSLGIDIPENKLTLLSWYNISLSKNLTEELIREFADKLHWDAILLHFPLSVELTYEFNQHINWETYFLLISADFSIMKQFILKTSFRSINGFKTSHLTDSQKQDIQKLFDLKYMFKK